MTLSHKKCDPKKVAFFMHSNRGRLCIEMSLHAEEDYASEGYKNKKGSPP